MRGQLQRELLFPNHPSRNRPVSRLGRLTRFEYLTFGQRYCAISLIIAQSTFLCSFLDTVASARRSDFCVFAFALSAELFFRAVVSDPTVFGEHSGTEVARPSGNLPAADCSPSDFSKTLPAENIRMCFLLRNEGGHSRGGKADRARGRPRRLRRHWSRVVVANISLQKFHSFPALNNYKIPAYRASMANGRVYANRLEG